MTFFYEDDDSDQGENEEEESEGEGPTISNFGKDRFVCCIFY